MALNSRMRLRRSASSSVVWVRSPVRRRVGCRGQRVDAATACRKRVGRLGIGRTFEAQCESESWDEKKSSSCPPDLRRMFVQAPARPEAKLCRQAGKLQ